MSKLSSSTFVSGCRGSFEHLCHACQLGRHVRLPFPTSSSRAAHNFDLIHCDVWISPVISISGYKYYLHILDDFSHYLWTFPLCKKSDTYPTLSHFFAWVSNQFDRIILSIQCDNGREFYNNASRHFFLSRGIHLRMSFPYTSPQNGRAEHMIQMMNDGVHSLLFQDSFPAHYWVEVVGTATYLLNRLPAKAVSHPTPYFALFDIHPSYDHLCVFGCACYPNLASTPHKLAPTPLVVSSSDTPPTIRDIGVSTPPPTESSSLVTSFSTSRISPFPPLLLPLSRSSTCSSTSTMCPPQSCPLPHRSIHCTASHGPACDALPCTATCSLGVS
jgi:hypothetical protein